MNPYVSGFANKCAAAGLDEDQTEALLKFAAEVADAAEADEKDEGDDKPEEGSSDDKSEPKAEEDSSDEELIRLLAALRGGRGRMMDGIGPHGRGLGPGLGMRLCDDV